MICRTLLICAAPAKGFVITDTPASSILPDGIPNEAPCALTSAYRVITFSTRGSVLSERPITSADHGPTDRAGDAGAVIRSRPPSRQQVALLVASSADGSAHPAHDDGATAAGRVLIEAGEKLDHVYFPHSGMLSLLVVLDDGKAIEVATVGREGVIGAMQDA